MGDKPQRSVGNSAMIRRCAISHDVHREMKAVELAL